MAQSPPTLDEVAASLAASIFLLTADEVKQLHAAIDEVSDAPASESGFKMARARLNAALRVGQDRMTQEVQELLAELPVA